MPVQPLPRSLDPLSGESLPGYVLRLAHRLDRAPGRIAVLTGLGRELPGRSATTVPVARMLYLDPATAGAFAHATRLSMLEVASLCLDSLRDRYPPLDIDPEAAGTYCQVNGISGLGSWVFTQSTRYCPQCLAGDGSAIQREHGGAWQKLWRVPAVFACTAHRRLLLHLCPECRQPIHFRRSTTGLLPRLQDATLHPAQCRSTVGAGAHWRAQSACSARLEVPESSADSLRPKDPALAPLLAVQERLIDLLQADGPIETSSVGQPTTTAQYFLDLRLLVGLLRASWPEAYRLAEPWMRLDKVDIHIQGQRRQVENQRGTGRNYDKPPLEAAACGTLLALADQMLALDDPHTARERLYPLVVRASAGSPWVGHFLCAEAYCSDGLRAAIASQVRTLRVTSRPGRKPGGRSPSRHCRFGHEHIPQYLPSDWYDRHFHDLTGIDPRFPRRTAPIKLVQMAEGGSLEAAGQLLGLPRGRATSASLIVQRWARDETNASKFGAALEALACELDAATDLIDYGRRRDALTTWSISSDDWGELIAEFGRWRSARQRALTDWGDRKRRTASVLVWARVTQGEHLLAPLVLAARQESGHRNELALSVHQARYQSRTGRRGRLWVDLKRLLDDHADQLAARVDSGWTPQLLR